jgi:histone acetyltransferase (RNA polymerase elongator complex component)
MKHAIIPLFIPHYGCPHQCIFCNQVRITGQSTPVKPEDISKEIDEYLASTKENRFWEAAFYGGSFTALPMDVMQSLLTPAKKALDQGRIQAIRLSTRPDCITDEILELLKSYGVSTVELGVQSLSNDVLKTAERGHTAEDAVHAVHLLKKWGFHTGLQFMTGLPGDTWQAMRHTARMGAALQPDFIRIYPVLVLKDTKLARMTAEGSYAPTGMKETIVRASFLKRWYNRHHIQVIRVGLQATEELDSGSSLVGGPYHPAMGELVDQYITLHLLRKELRHMEDPAVIQCSRRDRSKIMGWRKTSWEQMNRMLSGQLSISESDACPAGVVYIENHGQTKTVVIDEEKDWK